MAIVKITGIKDKPKATIKYIENPLKTNGGELVSGINTLTNIDYANRKMESVRNRYFNNNKIKAFHLIHSFSNKENINAETVHKITEEFIKRAFPSDTIAVLATHNNTNTLHTHCLINNTTLNGTHIRIDKERLEELRNLSNEICKEYGLQHSVINTKNGRAKVRYSNYYEYQNFKYNKSWKQSIREDIDSLIPKVSNVDQLYSSLMDMGYEIKFNGKYPSIRPKDKERFVRFKTLGYMYTEEMLKDRISGIDKYEIPLNGITKVYKGNKYLDKEIYYYAYRRGSIGCIIQLTAKIIAESLNLNNNNRKCNKRNYKAEKQLQLLENALITIKEKNYDSLEDINKDYNSLIMELDKMERWKDKYEKAFSKNKELAKKLNAEYEKVKAMEQQSKEDKNRIEDILKAFEFCKNKKYKELFNGDNKEVER